jgi:hypothetical protein
VGVYELSGAGSVKTPRTVYSSMNANNQYGAMVPIVSQTGFSGSTSQTIFNNIPQTYQDLMIVFSLRTTYAGVYDTSISMIANNSYTSIYSWTELKGNGSSASSSRTTAVNYGSTSAYGATSALSPTGTFASTVFHILNYANTSTFKTVLMRSAADSNGVGGTNLTASLIQTTAGIGQLLIQTNGNFVDGSTITLYGIRAVSS